MTFNCWCEQLVFGDQQERATIMSSCTIIETKPGRNMSCILPLLVKASTRVIHMKLSSNERISQTQTPAAAATSTNYDTVLATHK